MTYHKKSRKQNRKLFGFFLILFLLLAGGCLSGAVLLYHGSQERQAGSRAEVNIDIGFLDSPYAVLIDADSGSIIGEKNSEEMIFPASMAKIMTVYTGIKSIKELDATVTMSYDYYDYLYERDASRAGFEPGEEAVIRDLLYGALLPSGAECCMQLAMEAAGSEENFAEKMNQNGADMGLTRTHFTNCTGLHDDQQYSTVKDIGILLSKAAENKTFYEVLTTRSYSVGATNVHPEGFTFESSMFKQLERTSVTGGEILGGKTGYTDEAGFCLASMAKIAGRNYILVTAGWAESPRTDAYHINDALLAYDALGAAIAAESE